MLNYGLGGYLPQVINFLLVPLYTHYIDPRGMGILEICTTSQVLVVTLMRLGLAGSVSRLYFDCGEGDDLRDLITTTAVTITLASIIILGASLVAGPPLFARYLPEVPFHPYMDLALVTGFFLGAPDLQRRLLQARERSAFSAKLSVTFGALATLSNVIFVVGLGLGAKGVLWAGLLVAVIFAAVAAWNHRADLRGRLRWRHLRESLLYGLPILPHHLAAWAQQFVGRWALTAAGSVAMAGQLGIASKIASPLAVAIGAFSSAYAPVYFSWRTDLSQRDALTQTRRIADTILTLGAIAVAGAATFGVFFVRHALASSYAEAAPLVGIVAAALFVHLVYTLIATEIFFSKRTKWVSIIFIAASAVTTTLIAILGSRHGAIAAALAQLAGGFVSIVAVSVLSRASFPLPIAPRRAIVAIATSGAACLFGALLPTMTAGLEFFLCSAVFATLAALILVLSGTLRQLWSDVIAIVRPRRASAGLGPLVDP